MSNNYPTRELYPNEIVRTEVVYSKGNKQQCQYCKHQGFFEVSDTIAREPFVNYYKSRYFKVFSCYICGGLWHFKTKSKESNILEWGVGGYQDEHYPVRV